MTDSFHSGLPQILCQKSANWNLKKTAVSEIIWFATEKKLQTENRNLNSFIVCYFCHFIILSDASTKLGDHVAGVMGAGGRQICTLNVCMISFCCWTSVACRCAVHSFRQEGWSCREEDIERRGRESPQCVHESWLTGSLLQHSRAS